MHGGSSARFPNKPTEKLTIEKMYAIKQIKICAEYRDMLPRPRLDLSGTPGLRPIGLSPGSWQTSLGLGSMSRYSAQILICITCMTIAHHVWLPSWNRYTHSQSKHFVIFSCGEQLYKHSMSVCLSVCLSVCHTLFTLSRVQFFSDHGETWWGHTLG